MTQSQYLSNQRRNERARNQSAQSKRRLLRALQASELPMSGEELAEAIQEPHGRVRVLLGQLNIQGHIQRDDLYLYTLAEQPCDS